MITVATKENTGATKRMLPQAAKARSRNDVAVGAAERARILQRVKGMWKNRKPDPIRELKKMRAEWGKISR